MIALRENLRGEVQKEIIIYLVIAILESFFAGWRRLFHPDLLASHLQIYLQSRRTRRIVDYFIGKKN